MKFNLKSAVAGAFGVTALLGAPSFAQSDATSNTAASAATISTAMQSDVSSVAIPVRHVIAQLGASASTLQLQAAIIAAVPAGSDPAVVGLALNTVATEYAGNVTVVSALNGAALQSMVDLPVLGSVPANAVVVGGLVILGGVVIGTIVLDDDSDY